MKTYFYVALLSSLFLFSCSDQTSAQKPAEKSSVASEGTLYLRTFFWVSNNYMEISWIYLAKDGTIVRNPVHGSSPVNLALEKKDNGKEVGTYKTTADQMQITWSNGEKESWYIQKKGNTYTALNKGPVTVAAPLQADYRFEVTIPAHTLVTNENAMHSMAFKKDGTFQFIRFSDYPATLANGATGTYKVQKNTLLLQFQDGKTIRANIGVVPFSTQSPKVLVINRHYVDL